jgi:hypothetical protein
VEDLLSVRLGAQPRAETIARPGDRAVA